MRTNKLIPLLIVVMVGIGLLISAGRDQVSAQDGNLLSNPSFEGQYSSYVPEMPQELADCPLGICTTAQTAQGWKPWWVKERPTDVNPEYKPAEPGVGGNRIHSGGRAAQYFSFWSTPKAGLRQTVTVPANAVVQFTVFGHAWMTESDTSLVSDYSGTPNMRIGIDPTGGPNPYSPAVVWSEYKQAFDSYQQFSVQAQAQGDKVTVFTFSAPSVNPNSPDYGFKHNDIYWDDASLNATGGSAALPAPQPVSDSSGGDNTSAPAPAPAIVLAAAPTSTPDAEGVIYTQVQPGDSIWALAARAGLTLDEILQLNGMSRDDLIRTGDILITGSGDPPSEQPTTEEGNPAESTSGEEQQPEGAVDPAADGQPEAAPEAMLPTPAPASDTPDNSSAIVATGSETTGASVCLKAFDDPNQNGREDAGEALRPAVAFTISDGQSVVSNYVTDGTSEPFCIKGLTPGTYRVSRSSLPNEQLTTSGDHSMSLTEGSTLSLAFGSILPDTGATAQDGEDPATLEGDQGDGLISTIAIVAIIVAILMLAGVLAIILMNRRNTA